MTEEKINVLSVEVSFKGLDSLNDYEMMEILKKMAYNCKVDKEDMRGFYDMYYGYIKPPNINSFKEIIIGYVLKDPKFTPYIELDLSVKSTQPWDYYVPKDPPKGTIRITLLESKKVLVQQSNSKVIPLIMPKGQIIDIKSINMLNMDSLNSMFKTVEYYNMKQNVFSLYKLKCMPQKLDVHRSRYSRSVTLSPLAEHFISEINNINTVYREHFNSEYQFISSTMSQKLFLSYMDYIKNDNIDTTTLQKLKTTHEYNLKSIIIGNNKSKEEIKNYIMKSLIKMHFPKVYKMYRSHVNYKDMFRKLDSKSINLIEREYKMREDFQNAMAENKCPHLEILRKFRLAKNFKTKRKWYLELKPFIANPEETKQMHTCKRCKFNLICPHITRSIEGILNNVPGMEIRDKLDDYRDLMDKSEHQSLCKICTEVLFDTNFDEIQGETYKLIYVEVFKYLWSQALNIFVTLVITPKVNIFDFCSIIVYGILPIITRSVIPQIKNQMNQYIQSGELTPDFKVSIIMYVYAYILNMIRFNISNPKNTYVQIQLEENIKGKNISNYAEAIVSRFMTIHRSLFNQLGDFNVSELFITIYTELAKSDSIFAMEQVNSLEAVIFNEVIKNTIFNYSYQIATIMGKVDTNNNELNIFEYEDMVNEILGMKISDIARGRANNTYLQVYQPSYDIPAVKKYQSIISKPKLKLKDLPRLSKGRSIYSFGVYMRKFAQNEQQKSDDNILNPVVESDKKINYIANIYYKILTSLLDATKKWRQRSYTGDNTLTSVYAENGKEYKWDILIYNDGTEIKKGTGDGIKTYIEIVDYKDSDTGVLRSQTQKQNLKKTKDAYIRNTKRKVFFNFFKIKCPEKGIHDFSNGRSCSKCGLVDGQQSEEYYNKYYDIFLEEVKDSQEGKTAFEESGVSQLITYKPVQWKYNIRPIVEVTKLISQPQSVIESIGAMEGRTVEDVKLNKNRPPFPNSLYDPQLTLPISHYQWSIGTYNRIIFDNLDDDTLFQKHLKNAGIKPTDISDIKRKLPKDIFVQYNNILYWVLRDKEVKIADKYLCVIEMLCSFINDLSKINNITKEIAKYLMGSIIQEEFYTTVGSKYFDRTVLKGSTSIFLGDQDASEIYEDLDESKFEAEGDLSYEDVDIINNT